MLTVAITGGSGFGLTPVDHGQMRAATADRERAADVLKAAFAEGRLDQDEYADRLDQVYAAKTYGQLAALTADLPAGPVGAMAAGQALAVATPYQPAAGRLRPVNAAAVGSVLLAGFGVLAGLIEGSSNVVGTLGPFGVVAFLLAIVAFVQIARNDERGLLLASIGFVLSSVSVVAFFGSS